MTGRSLDSDQRRIRAGWPATLAELDRLEKENERLRLDNEQFRQSNEKLRKLAEPVWDERNTDWD